MIEMAEDSEKRILYGKNGLETTKNFTIETYLQKTLIMYDEVLKAYPNQIDEKKVSGKISSLNV